MIALYSIENDYNQPSNNLVALFKNKPSLEKLGSYFGGFPSSDDSRTLDIVKLWSMDHEVRIGNTDYRLEEVDFAD